MAIRHDPKDPDRTRMLTEIEAVIHKYAATAVGGYLQRMKQVETFAIDRANGDVARRSALKKQLLLETGGRCMHCHHEFRAASLHLHRVDPRFRFDETKNCGYFRENVELLCADCHQIADHGRRN